MAAHYTGLRSHLLGKGRGIKPHDLAVADLCRACHNQFDTGAMACVSDNEYMKKIDQSEQFMFLIMQTLIRRVDQGIITISDLEGQ